MKYKNVVRLPAMALLTATLVSGCAMTPEADSSADRADRDQGTPLHVSCKTNMTPEHRVELEAIDSMMEKSRNYAALARLEELPFQTQHQWLRWAKLLAKVEQLDYYDEVYRQISESRDRCT